MIHLLFVKLFYTYRCEQNKYNEIVSDFRYFKEQDAFDAKINGNDVWIQQLYHNVQKLNNNVFISGPVYFR